MIVSCTGSAPEAEDVAGNITIPEIAHDTEEDEYVVSLQCHTVSPMLSRQP